MLKSCMISYCNSFLSVYFAVWFNNSFFPHGKCLSNKKFVLILQMILDSCPGGSGRNEDSGHEYLFGPGETKPVCNFKKIVVL